jgi:hypothetical protein
MASLCDSGGSTVQVAAASVLLANPKSPKAYTVAGLTGSATTPVR